jgi:hypothetical protein
VEVKNDGIYYRFYPVQLTFRHIGWNELRCVKPVTYRPLAEYGGWGIRYGRNGIAYNVSGAEGVRLIKKIENNCSLGHSMLMFLPWQFKSRAIYLNAGDT